MLLICFLTPYYYKCYIGMNSNNFLCLFFEKYFVTRFFFRSGFFFLLSFVTIFNLQGFISTFRVIPLNHSPQYWNKVLTTGPKNVFKTILHRFKSIDTESKHILVCYFLIVFIKVVAKGRKSSSRRKC